MRLRFFLRSLDLTQLLALSLCWAALFCILPSPPSWSEAQPDPAPVTLKASISLTEALQIADEHNLSLRIAQKNLNLSQLDLKIAKRIPNPEFEGIYTMGRLYTQLSYPQQIGINQLIETAGKRKKRTDVAEAQLKLTDAQLNAMRWAIRSEVRQAYAELLGAEQNRALIEAQSDLLERLVDVTQKRVKAGAAPMSEFYQAQLARNQLTTDKNEATGRVEMAQTQLNSLLNNQLAPDFTITDTGLFQVRLVKTEIAPPQSTPLPQPELLVQKAIEGRLDYQAMQQEQVVAQKQLRLAKAQRIPDITVMVGYQYAITPSTFYGSRFFPGPNIGTTMELPILHNQGAEIAKVQTTLNQNELRLRNLERQIRLEVNTTYTRLKTAHLNLRFFETELIPEAKKVLSLSEKGYQAGKTQLASVIIAQQSFQQVISDYTQTVINYQNAWGELEKSVGSPLDAW